MEALMAEREGVTDEELLRQARAGDEAAFVILYRRRQGAVYRFALRVSGSTAMAEDVVQEVFLSLVDGPLKYDAERGSLASYLFGIARNQVLRRLERERTFVSADEATLGHRANGQSTGHASGDPLGEMARREQIEAVRTAVSSLPLPYREVTVLCELEGLSYFEAARIIGCPEGTIRSRLHRARALLVQKLRQASPEKTAPAAPRTRCFA